MYQLHYSTKFKKDYKVLKKRNYNLQLLMKIVVSLIETGTVPEKHLPHKLIGNYAGDMECHIKSDWLLIWNIDEVNNEIWLVRTGTHSDLF